MSSTQYLEIVIRHNSGRRPHISSITKCANTVSKSASCKDDCISITVKVIEVRLTCQNIPTNTRVLYSIILNYLLIKTLFRFVCIF